jgi:hypothetical protein
MLSEISQSHTLILQRHQSYLHFIGQETKKDSPKDSAMGFMGYNLSPQNAYVKVLIPSSSGCEFIWKYSH